MKIIRSIFQVIFMSISLCACTDLSETVYSEITEVSFEYTEDDTYSALGAAYVPARMICGNYKNYGDIQEICSDEIVMTANPSGGWTDGGIYRVYHLHTWTSEPLQLYNMWDYMYSGVVSCNQIITLLEEGTLIVPSETTTEALVAEMKTARAFYYWLLMDNFGEVPLVISEDAVLPAKSTVEEIYDQIVDDLTQAIPNLSEENNTLMYGRFNKWGAKTLLANIYLNSEIYIGESKWDECLEQCNDIIAAGAYSLESDYSDIFKTENENSTEIIFSVPYDNYVGAGYNMHLATLHKAMQDTYEMLTTPHGTGAIKAIPQFVDTYDTLDQRFYDTFIMGPQYASDGITPIYGFMDLAGLQIDFVNEMPNGLKTGEGEGYRLGKFEIEMGANDNLRNDFPFFRYAEVLMMKAECLLRTGEEDEAATIVTEVRQRAFYDNPEKATVTGEELLADTKYKYGTVEDYVITDQGNTDAVEYGGFYDELGYEFAYEYHRRRDMIRFGVFTTKSWLSHTPNGDYRTVFPIPQDAIDSNSNLEQNLNY